MKVTLAVEGTRGDVYPMLALGSTLRAAGHRVRICAPPDFADEARATGMEFRPLGVCVRDVIQNAAGALHSGGLAFAREMKNFAQESLEHQFRILPEATRDADCVVAAGTMLAAASAAELHGIPFRYVLYTPALLPSAEYTPALFPFQLRSRRGNRMLWRITRPLLNAGIGLAINPQRRKLGLAPVRDALPHLLSWRPIVAVDRPLAPVPDDCSFDFDQVRCLHPLVGEPLPEKLQSFLAAGPKPVYLGFGSMTDPDPATTTDRLLAAIERIGCRALISRGWAGLGDRPLPQGVMAIGAVSHAELFPRVAAVVHHGGSGTTHSAARAGVPQIVLPHLLDQFYFARRVETLGVAPPAFVRRRLSVEALADVIAATLDNEWLAERAQELGEQLAALGPAEIDPQLILAPRAA